VGREQDRFNVVKKRKLWGQTLWGDRSKGVVSTGGRGKEVKNTWVQQRGWGGEYDDAAATKVGKERDKTKKKRVGGRCKEERGGARTKKRNNDSYSEGIEDKRGTSLSLQNSAWRFSGNAAARGGRP